MWLYVLQSYDRDSYAHPFHSVHAAWADTLAAVAAHPALFRDGGGISVCRPGEVPYHFTAMWERGEDRLYITDPRTPGGYRRLTWDETAAAVRAYVEAESLTPTGG